MDKNQFMKLLYRHLDSKLTPGEEKEFLGAMQGSDAFKKEYEDTCTMRDRFKNSAAGSFSPFFVQRVMGKVNEEISTRYGELFFSGLYAQFRKVAVSSAAVILVIFILNLGKGGELTLESAFDLPEPTLENFMDPSIYLFGELKDGN